MQRESLTFGPFQVLLAERLLLKDGAPVNLSSRAFDILTVLMRHRGERVETDDLIAQVWPSTVVGEATLRVHLSMLRKALRQGGEAKRIANIPGRGYAFAGDIKVGRAPALRQVSAITSFSPSAGLIPSEHVLGRDRLLEAVGEKLTLNRLVTLVGPGGVGKTTVALEVARRKAARYRDGVVMLDLSAVRETAGLPQVLASAFGFAARSNDPLTDLAGALKDYETLILLDGCEHLSSGVAQIAEVVLRQAPGVRILATSQEALRAQGEWVLTVQPLEYPPAGADHSLDSTVRYPAIALFIERAAESLDEGDLQPADLADIFEICRRLDGIPLAIELAAARLDTLSLSDLSRSLNDRFSVLSRGPETFLPRHQTLRATLDWSYGRLSEAEKATFRAISLFRSCRAAAAVAVLSAAPVQGDPSELLMSLIGKSLIVADLSAPTPRYRFLETTRAYGMEKLQQAGEAKAIYRRHAEIFLEVAERAEAEWAIRPTAEWIKDYAPDIGNFRIALDWAFSDDGDAEAAVALTVALAPLFLQLSLVQECLERAQAAITLLASLKGDRRQWRMKLLAVLGWKMQAAGESGPMGTLHDSLAIAAELGDLDYQLRSHWALWLNEGNAGRPAASLRCADAFVHLAKRSGEPNEMMIGERMRSRALHFLGRQPEALVAVTAMLDAYQAPVNRSHLVRYQHDQRLNARIIQHRVRWLMGDERAAYEDMKIAVKDAQDDGHHLTLAYALAEGGCPLALLAGDFDAADCYIDLLEQEARTVGVTAWVTYAHAYRGELLFRRDGDAAGGARVLRDAIDALTGMQFVILLSSFVGACAEALLHARSPSEAMAIIEAALDRCAVSGEGWCVPELLRLKGSAWLASPSANAVFQANACFQGAHALAERQSAGAWVKRTAKSLADLPSVQSHYPRADALGVSAAQPLTR